MLAIFSLEKKFIIWAGYRAWARWPQLAQLIPCTPLNNNKNITQVKLCNAHTSKTQILLELLGPSYRPLLVQFSSLLTT